MMVEMGFRWGRADTKQEPERRSRRYTIERRVGGGTATAASTRQKSRAANAALESIAACTREFDDEPGGDAVV